MTRTTTEHAQCAAAIRRDLKTAYPTVPFRVRSKSFSGGDDVTIRWTDGPTTDQVARLTGQYREGHFNGQIDLYEYSNQRNDIPQVKYVRSTREISRAAYLDAIEHVNRRWGYTLVPHPQWNRIESGDGPRGNGSGWKSDEVYRLTAGMSLLCPHCQAPTRPGDALCLRCGKPVAV